jgi:transcriptional regulator with PAS, ATPase and Fis domain
VLPFQKEDFPRIEKMFRRTHSKRKKIEAKFEIPGKKGIWLEVEIKDDPRDPAKKIMALYDTSEVYDLRYLLEKQAKFQDIVGKSEPMQAVYTRIQEVASVDWTVLIEGQTGTGKELVARAIHATSHRRDKPFIAVNCAGLEDSLLGSQLFGHRRGAFTGAVDHHQGFFEAAAGGTLFLDEIGDISSSMQASLLRVLEEKEIIRVGESRPRKVDARILTATHRNLGEAAEAGRFRRDLLYRIRVARIALPPLKERREDIPLLCETFLAQGRAVTGKNVQRLSDETLRLLINYHWPGNVRELKSVVESAILGCKGTVIHKQHLPFEILHAEPKIVQESFSDDKNGMLAALEKTRGSRTKAARLLGMSRATFYRRMEEYKIKPSK